MGQKDLWDTRFGAVIPVSNDSFKNYTTRNLSCKEILFCSNEQLCIDILKPRISQLEKV
jgi:hypothetical protein